MPVTLQELQEMIKHEFPDSDVTDIREEGHRIMGVIKWQAFQDLDVHQRNRLVTEKVRDKLGLRGLNVGFLFPLAPGESL